MTETTCPRKIVSETCAFCDAAPNENCPLDEAPPFAGPAIGATVAAGECDGGDVCEACQ